MSDYTLEDAAKEFASFVVDKGYFYDEVINTEYCIGCGYQRGDPHKEDCVVAKAENYLKGYVLVPVEGIINE